MATSGPGVASPRRSRHAAPSTGAAPSRRSSLIRYRVGRTANRITRGRLQQHFGARAPEFVERTINCPNWPRELDGFRILHLSDFHVGELITAEQASRLVNDLRDVCPQMVAVTGDFVDYHCEGIEPLLESLVALPSDLGTWGVLGNHDKIVDPQRFLKACRETGLPILNNASARISLDGICLRLSGIDWDYDVAGIHRHVARVCATEPVDVSDSAGAGSAVGSSSRVDDMPRTISGAAGATCPEGSPEPHILLAHHPEAFDAAIAHGVDLVLSGHTHGGQFNLKRRLQRFGGQQLGIGLLTHRYPWGIYARGSSRLHVTSGVGSWFPLRMNCPTEIVLLEIRSGAPSVGESDGA